MAAGMQGSTPDTSEYNGGSKRAGTAAQTKKQHKEFYEHLKNQMDSNGTLDEAGTFTKFIGHQGGHNTTDIQNKRGSSQSPHDPPIPRTSDNSGNNP